MRGCFKAALVFGLVAVASPAFAQGRGGFGGGGGGAGLIGNPGVQKELKLDEAQIEKASAIATEVREKMTEARSQLEGLEGEERTKKMQELNKASTDSAMKSLGAFLKPEQMKRFKQIELQQRGVNALTDPEVAKALGVTDEQKTKVSTILADARSEMQEAQSAANGDRQAAMEKFQAIRKSSNTKAMALMTDDQKKTWKEMTGDPFEVTFQPRAR